MNDNSYYIITSFIHCNTDFFYNVITITVYQTYPKFIKMIDIVNLSKTLLLKFKKYYSDYNSTTKSF
jgi:hypothetical protein